jgi:hypothetical protein
MLIAANTAIWYMRTQRTALQPFGHPPAAYGTCALIQRGQLPKESIGVRITAPPWVPLLALVTTCVHLTMRAVLLCQQNRTNLPGYLGERVAVLRELHCQVPAAVPLAVHVTAGVKRA